MEETPPDSPENVEKRGVPCPKCGAVHDSYPSYDGRVKCPSCHLFLKRDSIPEEFLVKRETKKRERRPRRKARDEPATGARQETGDGDEGRGTSPDRRERRPSSEEGMWREEKEPNEIVAEVLERHNAKPTFIDYVTERIQDMGEIRTDMLTNMLYDLDPGVTKKQIPYIIEDVVAALRRAEEEARQRERGPSYAVGRGHDRDRGRSGSGYPGAYPSRRDSRDSRGDWWPSSGYRESFGGEPAPLSKEDVVDMVDRMMEKRGKEDRLTALEKQRIQDKADAEKMMSEKFAELNETLAAKKEETPEPQGMTREELVEIMKSEKKDSYLQYMEQKSKDDKALHERTLNTLIEERKESREDKKELEEKLSAARVPTSSGEYSRDETRLLADGLKIVGAKEPIKNAGKIIIEFIKPGGSRGGEPPRREKVGEEGITDLLPDEFVREE